MTSRLKEIHIPYDLLIFPHRQILNTRGSLLIGNGVDLAGDCVIEPAKGEGGAGSRRSRQMANQLREVLSSDVRSAEGLVTKMLGSFTNTLLILNGSNQGSEELIYQVQANSNTSSVTASAAAGPNSSSWDVVHDDTVKSEDSSVESCKSTETFKDCRGSYNRRKTSHSWTKDTLDLVDDGHAWTKYGQKMIHGTKHPRNYFRCTHKLDHGCKATKHVQMIQDEPQLFRTTYIGNHTCTNYLRSPELILDCSSLQDSSRNMISFDSTKNDLPCKQEHPFFSALTTSIKKESVKEEEVIEPTDDHDYVTHHAQSSSSTDYLMSPGVGVFDSSGDLNEFSSSIFYDHDDVISKIMAGHFDNGFDYSYEF